MSERTPWPRCADASKPAIVVASYNTRLHIARLVFSLHRFLGADRFGALVVVDNGSSDGSLELLRELRDQGLLHLIENASQRYHGPAISQGVDWLAERARDRTGPGCDYVWVLDSDVVVLRDDALEDARASFRRTGAAALGHAIYDPWQRRVLLQMCSFMFDPALLWQPGIAPFEEHGDPSLAMQLSAEASGLRFEGFPFVESGYIVHLGCQTLAGVAAGGERGNRYYGWAVDNRTPHYEGYAAGGRLYRAFCEHFERETDSASSVEAIAAACHRAGRLALTA